MNERLPLWLASTNEWLIVNNDNNDKKMVTSNTCVDHDMIRFVAESSNEPGFDLVLFLNFHKLIKNTKSNMKRICSNIK